MKLEPAFEERLGAAVTRARERLLAERCSSGHWTGELSSSALSTATAVTALTLWAREASPPVWRGLEWLTAHANPDGGWGDTVCSPSNLSTTALAWAAFGAVSGADTKYAEAVRGAEGYLKGAVEGKGLGSRGSWRSQLSEAIIASYGQDRTFSAPILTMCALSGRLGKSKETWSRVIQLPFELAALPRSTFALLRLPVVSYALPALIAIGYVRHVHRPTRNPILRLTRNLLTERAFKVLERLQPANGGFLEATPLTSFVLMSLAGSGRSSHPVAKRAANFIRQSQREDGSWPIDSNLATWLTTLSVNALRGTSEAFSGANSTELRNWLLRQQFSELHPYTGAAPGGWAWTDLPGGVPDADDTAGALLALKHLLPPSREAPEISAAARKGIRWLLGVQNRDGGIPTFCRGWGKLPFDRSSPDLTAHAIRAWLAWHDELPIEERGAVHSGLVRAVDYLVRSQRPDGAWVPLWFGNQEAPGQENPTYGTSKVLLALFEAMDRFLLCAGPRHRGIEWLMGIQHACGGWGGARGVRASVEETSLAVEALAAALSKTDIPGLRTSLENGVTWLAEQTEAPRGTRGEPIGLYFARLWYSEKLYPLIFSVAALGRAQEALKFFAAGKQE